MLRDIERMTAQNEVDVAKYQNYTEKRYNTEKFVEEMEMKKEFPELAGALEVERAHMLKLSEAKIESKKMEHNLLRGKDIVLELLEQSVMHEELDKIRRDLDEFAYKAKDSSYLLTLPFLNPNEAIKKPTDVFNDMPEIKAKPKLPG